MMVEEEAAAQQRQMKAKLKLHFALSDVLKYRMQLTVNVEIGCHISLVLSSKDVFLLSREHLSVCALLKVFLSNS